MEQQTSTPQQPQPQPQPPPPPPPPSTPQPPEQQQTPSSSVITPPPTAAGTTTTITAAVSTTPTPPPIISSIPSTTATTSLAAPVSAAPSPPIPSTTTPNPNPNPTTPTPTPTPTSTPQPSLLTSQTRPPFSRSWQQQQPSPFSHYSLPAPPLPLPPHSSPFSSSSPSSSSNAAATTSSSPSLSVPPAPRGGMAIGVPAHHHGTPPSPPTSFSSLNPPSFGQPFGALGRNLTDSGPASTSSQVRPVGGIMGSLGSSSAMRPPAHQLRPSQSSVRPQPSPSPQSPGTQNFQGHGMLRVSSVGSPGSPSLSSSQSPQPLNQPWLSSGSQGRPPLPPTSLRPQLSSQSMQQRPHIPQQHHHSVLTTPQQQQSSSSQQSPTSGQSQEHFALQFPQSRVQQSLSNPQQRGQSLGIQRPSLALTQSGAVQTVVTNRTAGSESEESCNRILSKRSIQEIVSQIDPSEKLDPEVEDILVDIADDFVESITTFGCSLAKHRKSTTLEAKDILLHLERNWNMTLPGFGGDEIKMYRKPLTSDIHKERFTVIKKSILAAEVTNSKSSAGQAGGNAKIHLAKGPTNILGSPTTKGH